MTSMLTGKVCVCTQTGANYNEQNLSSHKLLDCITRVKIFYKLGAI